MSDAKDTKKLRLQSIIYVARYYGSWPSPDSNIVQSVNHPGYSWTLDDGKLILLRDEDGIHDKITENDIKNYIEKYKTLDLHETYNSAIIFDFAKSNNLSWDYIGISEIGKSIIALIKTNGELHSTYLFVAEEFEYKRVL